MEPDASVLSLSSVATLWNTCTQALDVIVAGKRDTTAYNISRAKLELEQARLFFWGEGLGLLHLGADPENAERTVHPHLERLEIRVAVVQILRCMHRLFESTATLQAEYGLYLVSVGERDGDHLLLDIIFKRAYRHARQSAQRHQGALLARENWAICEGSKFERLVKEIRGHNKSLLGLFPDIIAKTAMGLLEEIESSSDIGALGLLHSAAADDYEDISLKAAMRLTVVGGQISTGSASAIIADHRGSESSEGEVDNVSASKPFGETLVVGDSHGVVDADIQSVEARESSQLLRLNQEIQASQNKIKELQQVIAALLYDSVLTVRDEDYFEAACNKLYNHVEQWVLQFSKHSDSRRCRVLGDLQDKESTAWFEQVLLNRSDINVCLADRVYRRNIFMAVVMAMVFKLIFARYLFSMALNQRRTLKSLERQLAAANPRGTVNCWRANTLSLMAKDPTFTAQCNSDLMSVSLRIFNTLSTVLPPPSQAESQLLDSLRKVLQVAVDLSIQMRTQLANYTMLPPLTKSETKISFNATLMNERSGRSNEELEAQNAAVHMVLFPLVVKKGDDVGEGEDEAVIYPAQVLVTGLNKLGMEL
jgi:hypothetical protein